MILKSVLLQLAALIALMWMSLGIGLMFYIDEYPVAAFIMNTISILGVCIANAITDKGKKDA